MLDGSLTLGVGLDLGDPTRLAQQARAAEAAGIALVVLDDPRGTPGRGPGLDPIEAAAFVAAIAPSPALLVTAAATHAEPFHLSNRLASLDWGSAGRAGWLATVDTSLTRARAYGASAPGAEAARAEASGVIEAVRRLWDSWEDGALVADTATGRFLDADRLHYTDDPAAAISVRGPALMPRPVQGQVPIFARDPELDAEVVVVGEPVRGDRPTFVELEVGADTVAEAVRSLHDRVDGALLLADDAEAVLAVLRELTPEHPPRDRRTLRQRLGLPRPANRFAIVGSSA